MTDLSLEALFKAFAKFGDNKSDGKAITLAQSDKWMKQAKIMGKAVTTTDTASGFEKFKTNTLTYENYMKFLDELAKAKKMDAAEMKTQLLTAGMPDLAAASLTQAKKE